MTKKMLLVNSPAFRFVLIMGMVNLFGDMTYEGGGSINGPFLGALGASAAVIGIVAGVGEFLGYSLRSAPTKPENTGRYPSLATRLIFWPFRRWPWPAHGKPQRR